MRENYQNLTGNLMSNSRTFVEIRRKPQKKGKPGPCNPVHVQCALCMLRACRVAWPKIQCSSCFYFRKFIYKFLRIPLSKSVNIFEKIQGSPIWFEPFQAICPQLLGGGGGFHFHFGPDPKFCHFLIWQAFLCIGSGNL